MKKFFIFLTVFLGLTIVGIVSVPFFVDIDQYRNKFIEIAEQQINGKLELGKLKLSLWGQIRVEIDGLKLSDLKGKEIIKVNEAYFHLPFISILSGSPVLTFKMKNPELTVIQDQQKKINILSLIKEKPPESSTLPSSSNPSPVSQDIQGNAFEKMDKRIAGIISRSKLGFELENAKLLFEDQLAGIKSELNDLNFILKDLSLSHPIQIEIWANLDSKLNQQGQKKAIIVQGPMRLKGQASIVMQAQVWKSVDFFADIDLDALEILVPGTFEKKKGIPFHSHIELTAAPKKILIKKFDTQFFNVQLSSSGHLNEENGLNVVDFKLKSNDIDLKSWVDLLPALKEFELSGLANVEAQIQGPTEKLNYDSKLEVKKLKAKSPLLKTQPEINAFVHIIPNQVEKILMTLKAPGSDLKLEGKVVSFVQPQVTLNITSSGMDLNQWVKFPPSDSSQKPKAEASSVSSSQGSKTHEENLDSLLDPLRKNTLLHHLLADVSLDIKSIEAKKIKASDIKCKMKLKDLVFNASSCGLKIFEGSIQSFLQVQLLPAKPVYQFDLKVANFSLDQALAAEVEAFKNTLKGKADFSVKGQGSSLNTTTALKNLKAQGEMKVSQASFSSIDVMKMASEALNRSAGQLENKVPALKGKISGKIPNINNQYGADFEMISSHFTIDQSSFVAPDFFAKAKPNKAVDLKGKLKVGIEDYSLDANWDIIDTYNLTKAQDISIDQGGVKIDRLLIQGNAPFSMPIHVGCNLKNPCYSYTEVPMHLSKIALSNIEHVLADRVKSEGKKKATQLIEKVIPGKLGNQLKGLFK